MTNKIVDLSEKTTPNKIFFGDFDQVIRVDNISSSLAAKLKADSEGNTWFAREVKYDGDATRFAELPAVPRRMFRLNIGYQTVMDSGVSNGYLDSVRPIVTDPIWKIVYSRIGIEEVIHAESYSYGLNQMFGSQSEEFLDIIYTDPFIKERMSSEIDAFAEIERLRSDPTTDYESDDTKKSVLRMLLAAYLLEGIKFPFSFFVAFTINKSYDNAIQGMARLLKLIAHDEFTFHVVTNLNVMELLRDDPSQGYSHLFTNGWFEKEITKMASLIQDQELEWMHYLLQDGPIPGFNAAIGEHFIKYWVNNRLQSLRIPVLNPGIVINDIVKWYNNYKDLNKSNTALQEADNLGYQKGALSNDLNGDW